MFESLTFKGKFLKKQKRNYKNFITKSNSLHQNGCKSEWIFHGRNWKREASSSTLLKINCSATHLSCLFFEGVVV